MEAFSAECIVVYIHNLAAPPQFGGLSLNHSTNLMNLFQFKVYGIHKAAKQRFVGEGRDSRYLKNNDPSSKWQYSSDRFFLFVTIT